MKLANKTGIVIGSATGIGAEIARQMAKEGANVVLGDINLEAAEQVAAEIASSGREAIAVRANIAEETEVQQLVNQTVETFGGINVLVNNAAALSPEVIGPDSQTDAACLDLEIWDQTMAVNLRGYLLAMKFAIPEMLKVGGGTIVNTSSIASIAAEPVRGAYAVSKAAVNQLSTHIATAYGKRGIRCNAVAPGFINTNRATEKMYQSALPDLLTPYLGSTQNVADAVIFLASDEAAFITGQVIQVDGGVLAHSPYL